MNEAENYSSGQPFPLGATYLGEGTNFAIYAAEAKKVILCLFDGNEEINRIEMECTHHIFHCYLEGVAHGQQYGYRIYGAYLPLEGYRFNPNKLLIDPYAKAISGDVIWNDAVFGYDVKHEDSDLSFSAEDSAPFIPKSIVINENYDWGNDTFLNIPLHKSIIYELHVKGFTKLNSKIPEYLRGTYAGLGHPASIDYLQSLGITAVELMPVHQFVSDGHLQDKGLSNYWGYNTIGFFAPDFRYAYRGNNGQQVNEFKDMVKALHRAGLEVILDVVYNHTAEGNEKGPTLSLKGIDNTSYYRLEGERRYYTDFSGTGNTLNTQHPITLRLIMDSLRYWVTDMHIDGFRFDLATALSRGDNGVEDFGLLFNMIHQDPVLCKVKLIAEPWDVGDDGYQVGKFPAGWSEWNGKYRDDVRRFWRGDGGLTAAMAQRFLGSADLYQKNKRLPSASINFITAHDGFTLKDLVSYEKKHNLANGDNNEDGEAHNHSWNCGVEGETDDQGINDLRRKYQRNLLATLLLSEGVPMISAGDEFGKTQNGNNNAYCQDNEISWLHWDDRDEALLEFTKSLIQFRLRTTTLISNKWKFNSDQKESENVAWFNLKGQPMLMEDWHEAKGFGMVLSDFENKIYLIIINGTAQNISFQIPVLENVSSWILEIDTETNLLKEKVNPNKIVKVSSKSIKVFRAV